MSKYGFEKFHYEILDYQVEDYNEREKYWIQQYNSLIPNGYNITSGGDGFGYGIGHPCSKFKDEKTCCLAKVKDGQNKNKTELL